jgi:glycosyltransferase involved in cell wall biosynthesis
MSRTLVSINTYNIGSTGRIMRGITESALAAGYKAYCAYGRGDMSQINSETDIIIGSSIDVYRHALYARITNKTAFGSKKATLQLVKKLEQLKPDIIHLHNLHHYYLNIEVLFEYLKRSKATVVWTLHDCWSFTGHCSHFDAAGCEKWKNGCGDCPQTHSASSKGLFDNSRTNWQRKKELFTSLPPEQLKLVTPSKWLADLVKDSFLGKFDVQVMRNGIDTDIFKIRQSDSKAKQGLSDKKVLLAVASPWSQRKGLDDIKQLATLLDDSYTIIIVGLNKQQKRRLPPHVIGFEKTDSLDELADLYAGADVFINPTHEDNYPTVNLEALACGTPVITYNSGGSPECSDNEFDCRVVLDRNPKALANVIRLFFSEERKQPVTIIDSYIDCAKNYLELYKELQSTRRRSV